MTIAEAVVILDKSRKFLLFSLSYKCYNVFGDNMKVITIKQLWASLIVNGFKEYEFRSWKTNYRGKILIHAGLSTDNNMLKKLLGYNLEYTKGAIIGEADLVDCILVEEKLDGCLRNINSIVYGNNHIGNYAWKLENIKKYDNPIYIKGKLGL